ncbi:hypothetical protein K7432_003039 [Basidiobolus ranarum]|uniref:Mei2-like C-terminal RNA recognition motif domain-containing protein n=1 Tax=Basidiobolus ranarum TaxID=34480 RepID=A0ABR2X0I4_9FUNG
MLATAIDKTPIDLLLENDVEDQKDSEHTLPASIDFKVQPIEVFQNSPLTPRQQPKPGQAFLSDSSFGSIPRANISGVSASIFSKSKNYQHYENSPFEWGLENQMSKLSFEQSNVLHDRNIEYPYEVKKDYMDNSRSMFEGGKGYSFSTSTDAHELSSCNSTVPTHFVSVDLLPHNIDTEELKLLKNTGKVWQVLTDRVHDLDMIIIAYYDLRDAIAAVQQLRASKIQAERTSVNFVKISQLAKCTTLFNSFKDINDFDGRLLLSYCPPNAFTSNMQLILESCGDIREISQLPYKSSVVVEYYDIRSAVAAEEKLHRIDPQNTQYQVNFCPDEDFADRIIIFRDCHDSGSLSHFTDELNTSIWNDAMATTRFPSTNAKDSFQSMLSHSNRFYPTKFESQQLPTRFTSPNQFHNFDLRSDIWSTPWQYKPNVSGVSRSYSPSNMPRFSSNSNPCENIVPGRNQVDVWKVAQGIDTRTTFMIRNIPNKYTQKMLLECIDETHEGEYDFVYLRIDFKNHCNVGYAFINFIDVK